jgi:hypothetical protein
VCTHLFDEDVEFKRWGWFVTALMRLWRGSKGSVLCTLAGHGSKA